MDRCSIRCCVVWTVGDGRSVVVACSLVGLDSWTVACRSLCGETQEEQMRVSRGNWSDLEFAGTCGPAELLQSIVERVSEILTFIDVDDDAASCDSASARVVHSPSSSGSRIWTCRYSASNQQSRDSSSSERYSESH